MKKVIKKTSSVSSKLKTGGKIKKAFNGITTTTKQTTIKPNKPFNQWTSEEKIGYKAWLQKTKGREAVTTFLDSARVATRKEIEDKRTKKEEDFKKLLAGNIKDKPFQLWTGAEKVKHKADMLASEGGREKYTSFRDSITKDTKKRNIESLFKNTRQQGFGTDTTAYKKYAIKQEKIAEKNKGKSNLEGLNTSQCNKRGEAKGSCSDPTNVSKGQSLRDTR
jgi:hypothetical protein